MKMLRRNHQDNPIPDKPGVECLFVNGKAFANSAAKFWASLTDEILADFPACRSAEVAGIIPGKLNRNALFPGKSLENSIPGLLACDFETEMRNASAELELLGEPVPISVRLFSGNKEIFSGNIPPDCGDSEILPFLVTWLLEWSSVPETMWNNKRVSGSFTAVDKKRGLTYMISFRLDNNHLSEGLWQRKVVWTPSRLHETGNP